MIFRTTYRARRRRRQWPVSRMHRKDPELADAAEPALAVGLDVQGMQSKDALTRPSSSTRVGRGASEIDDDAIAFLRSYQGIR